MSIAITVTNLGKRFRRQGANAPTSFKELFTRGLRGLKAETFWGLREVNFSIASGRTIGIIGRNGAGKSTLLRLVGGVGRPDTGTVKMSGRIGALLDLGAGLHPELTGRENVYVAGVISGMTRAEVSRRFADIVAFAELEDFIDSPLRTYSTGMRMRLAFAVAVHIDPQILLIDEVLAVGDIAFQRKCLERIAQFKQQGCTILIVSHDSSQIQNLCDEVIWLRDGKVAMHGPTEQVLEAYTAFMGQSARQNTPDIADQVTGGHTLKAGVNRFGSQSVQIRAVRLRDAKGMPVTNMESGAALRVEVDYHAPTPISGVLASITIDRVDGHVCLDTNTEAGGVDLPDLHGAGSLALQIDRLELSAGEYLLSVGLYEQNWASTYDYHWQAYPFSITLAPTSKGVLAPPLRWSTKNGA
ncbi:ABC transporter related protein [Oscillochloris trichoides DG-6]|uniref:ABC transporter related protein n=1 Tax=Oscillochloris trichoides DG-6 TaxID=765420 RepID=E1IBL6_9CHLR|nr:ABC transporter ATP-binding protein [Oscillochloris trichoides]EFO81435.1 ABC transporter related protein [Oscillochloris trichoides DG-6]